MALNFRKKKNISELPEEVNVATKAEVQELEAVNHTDTIPPEQMYEEAHKSRKKAFGKRVACFMLAEVMLLALCLSVIITNHIQSRTIREVEMKLTGTIHLKTGSYIGGTDFGWFDGNGDFAFRSGTTYSGNWNENELYGAGELKVPAEGEYKGEFLGSQKSGQGVFRWEDGTVYDGSWKNDEMSGKGIYTTPAGLICSGTFKGNHFDSGLCTFKNDTGNYELTYLNGKIDHAEIEYSDGTTYFGGCGENGPEGTGTMKYNDGDQFTGSFADGKRNGSGVYSWASGEQYDGEWTDDSINGNGTYLYVGGASLEGNFKDNTFVKGNYHISNNFGDYVFTFASGKPSSASITLKDGTKYSGDMNENGLNGSAQITYSNGDTYDGHVENGQKSGYGKYVWKNGASYDGN